MYGVVSGRDAESVTEAATQRVPVEVGERAHYLRVEPGEDRVKLIVIVPGTSTGRVYALEKGELEALVLELHDARDAVWPKATS